MSEDAIWDSLDPDPLLVRRDHASQLRSVAHQLPELQGKPYLTEPLAKILHQVAMELETAKNDDGEFASVTAARKALQDLRAVLPHVGRDLSLAIKVSGGHTTLRRNAEYLRERANQMERRWLSAVKEARRQAARAKTAEAKLTKLQGEQS